MYAPVSDSRRIWFGLDSKSPVDWLSTVIFFTYGFCGHLGLFMVQDNTWNADW